MKIERFEDIESWVKAKELTLQIYKSLEKCKDYSFKDQIQRASISIINNIAEGFERRTNPEFIQYLFIAKGSCAEVRSMLHLAKDIHYIMDDEYLSIINLSGQISRLLSGFIKALYHANTKK